MCPRLHGTAGSGESDDSHPGDAVFRFSPAGTIIMSLLPARPRRWFPADRRSAARARRRVVLRGLRFESLEDRSLLSVALVGDVAPGVPGSFPSHLTAVGSTLYFTAADGSHGVELWKT